MTRFCVSEEALATTVAELASPRYAGRLTGTEGNWMAAQYIADVFHSLDLEIPRGTVSYMQHYLQPSRLIRSQPLLQIMDGEGKTAVDFSYVTQFTVMVYPGWTSSADVTGLPVILSDVQQLDSVEEGCILLVPRHISESMADMFILMSRLTETGDGRPPAVAAVILEADHSDRGYFPASTVVESRDGDHDGWPEPCEGPLLFSASVPAFTQLMFAVSVGWPVHLSADFYIGDVRAANVVGAVRGVGRGDGESWVIVGAHFDHMGSNMNGTYNPGALDNASGVAAMLEIARIVSGKPYPPPRSVLFIALNGEEQRLFGSTYYTSNPCYPLENAVMINMDSVGAAGDVPLYVEEFSAMITDVAPVVHSICDELGIKYVASSSNGSDHAAFSLAGVECVNLIHPDFSRGYHGPGDTPEYVDSARITQVVQAVLNYIYRADE